MTRLDDRREGGTTALTLLLLTPLLALVAFAVDLNYIWRTDIELQTAADAAAQAATVLLTNYTAKGNQPNLTASGKSAVRSQANTAVVSRAALYGKKHTAGGVSLEVNSSDIELGYIADPTVGS